MMKSFLVLFAFTLALAEEFAIGSRKFTGSVYNQLLVDNDDNILVSPFSLEIVLALTQSGAKGKTGSEIRTTLNLPETKEATEAVIQNVLPEIQGDLFTLKTANKIYVENEYPIQDTFKTVAKDVYQASFQNIEFAENVEAADTINQWVEEQTANKIQDLLDSTELSAFTRVVLVNALYFQGNWSIPFQPLYTRKASFFYTNDDSVSVDMMLRQSQVYNYAASAELDARILELPFYGEDASMTVILPNTREGLSGLEKQVDLILATPQFTQDVDVYLPKFRIESTINFADILEKMGVHAAFNPAEADFSGIAGAPGDLHIGKIKQKTFIDVNEMGVEAAAATAIDEPDEGSLPQETISFIADHPFFFYIKVKDVILFEGRVLQPKYDN